MAYPKCIDLPDVLAARLRDAGYDDAGVRALDELKGGGIAVRRVPSTTTARHFDGRRDVTYLVQVVVARERELDAVDQCAAIAELVPTLDLPSANGTYSLTSVDVYTDPRELEATGFPYVWEVRFQALITTNERRY
jgi:hypothetical protein